MVAEPPRPSFAPYPQPSQAPPEQRVIVVHHGGPSFFSAYWMIRLGIVALILVGSGGRWAYHHFGGGSRVGEETLDAFDDPEPVATATPTPPPAAPPPPAPAAVPAHAPAPAAHPAAAPPPPPAPPHLGGHAPPHHH
jgi:hypothetical protein